ncbi:hypothetical protein [Halosimplex halophilum]|uniref:hypothetical protein n=1 Tax=Halosimplex halophilum TaxID=2559572 RepID=UPI00107F2E6A|nr:hypothetical protein [Halosimplex halophilum]
MSAALDLEVGPVAVGALVGLAGLTFLLEPLVGPLAVGGLRVRPVALSAVVLAAALLLGAAVFYRRGRRLFALAHAVFGLAWTGIVLGTATGSGTLLVGGVVLVIAGCGFLVTQARER